MKKIFLITGIIFLSINLQARNYYVKTSGVDVVSGGTNWQTAWQTISYAANALQPGDTVIVSNGTYNEGNIVPANSGTSGNYITYRAFSKHQAIVDSGFANSCFNFFTNPKSYIIIDGFEFKKANFAFDVRGTSQINVSKFNIFKNNIIHDTSLDAIVLHGFVVKNSIISNDIYLTRIAVNDVVSNRTNIIFHNKLHNNNNFGILITYSSIGNIFSYNMIYSNSGNGVDIQGGTYGNIINYIFYSNHIYNHLIGLRMNDFNDCVFTNNKIYKNGTGIYNFNNPFYGTAQRSLFKNNEIYSNTNFGFRMDNTQKFSNTIILNNIYGNQTGIETGSGNDCRIVQNQIYNSTTGISVSGNNNIITNNNIFNNRYGINIAGTGNYFYKNQLNNNYLVGIYINSDVADNNTILDNNIYSQTNGIMILEGDRQTIQNNNIYNNFGYGIYMLGSTNSVIRYNTIRDQTTGIGLGMSRSLVTNSFNLITGNNIGVFCTNLTASVIIKNHIFNNLSNDLLYKNSSVKLTNNWWGSTKVPDIALKMSGLTNYSTIMPYRLFGPFDLTPGADTLTPGRVTIIQSILSNKQVFLKWNKAAGADVDHYNIYEAKSTRFSNLTKNDTFLRTVQTNCFLKLFSTNYIYITAADNNPVFTNESWYSTSVLITNNNLGQPVMISHVAIFTGQVFLEWNDLPNESSYTLFRALSNSTNLASKISGFSLNQTNHYDSNGMISGTWYYYWVRAYNAFDRSAFSTVVSNITMPRIPQITSITAISPSEIVLSWNLVKGASQYWLFRNTENDSGSSQLVYSGSQTNYENQDLQPGTTYYYWVKAVNESGSAGYSEPRSATTIRTYEDNLEKLIIGPNPYKPNSGRIEAGSMSGGIIFDRLTRDAKIEIYTVDGQLVSVLDETDGDGRYVWSVPDKIASGVYIAIVTNRNNEKKVQKIMIIK